MSRVSIILVLVSAGRIGLADDFERSPTLGPGPMTNGAANNVQTPFPFLIKQARWASMRYQQVYAASSFTNVPADFVYLTTISFFMNAQSNRLYGWGIPSMQIDLSTTQMSPDNLSTNFSENVGPDDRVVFGPVQRNLTALGGYGQLLIPLDRAFHYNPASGNLLLDVRIFDGTGTFDPNFPWLWAQSVASDEVSSVWASNVTAITAMEVDTTALFTTFQFSPVPTLRSEFYPAYAGAFTNMIRIVWPSQPSAFALQWKERLDSGLPWQPVTNQIEGIPDSGDRWIQFPRSSAGPSGFYRLVGPPP
jgi:hypothetical protein